MKPKMKTICSLVAGATMLAASAMGATLPDKFKDYRTTAKKFPCQNIRMGQYMMHQHLYDVDGDGKPDIGELRPMFPKDGQMTMTKEPLIYGFDINGNGRFDAEEMIRDPKMDGLNGNEESPGQTKKQESDTRYGI